MEDNLPCLGASGGRYEGERRDTERMEQLLQLERVSGMRSKSSHSSQGTPFAMSLLAKCFFHLPLPLPFRSRTATSPPLTCFFNEIQMVLHPPQL